MLDYTIGYVTPCGRGIVIVKANSRKEALNIAWSQGYTVCDCSYKHEDD